MSPLWERDHNFITYHIKLITFTVLFILVMIISTWKKYEQDFDWRYYGAISAVCWRPHEVSESVAKWSIWICWIDFFSVVITSEQMRGFVAEYETVTSAIFYNDSKGWTVSHKLFARQVCIICIESSAGLSTVVGRCTRWTTHEHCNVSTLP